MTDKPPAASKPIRRGRKPPNKCPRQKEEQLGESQQAKAFYDHQHLHRAEYDDDHPDHDGAYQYQRSSSSRMLLSANSSDMADDAASVGSRSSKKNASKSARNRNWTRSLSPRRTAADFHDSFQQMLISPAVNSLRRLSSAATRTTRSQSPVSRDLHHHRQQQQQQQRQQHLVDVAPLAEGGNEQHQETGVDAHIGVVGSAKSSAKTRSRGRTKGSTSSSALEQLPSRDDGDPKRPTSSRRISLSKSDSQRQKQKSQASHKQKRQFEKANEGSGEHASSPRRQDRRHREVQSKAPRKSSSSEIGLDKSPSKARMSMARMHHSFDEADFLRLQDDNDYEEGIGEIDRNAAIAGAYEAELDDVKSDDDESLYQESSTNSMDLPPPPKPSSDPGRSSSSIDPNASKTKTTSKDYRIPPSSVDLTLSFSHHIEKPASDPGRSTSSPICKHQLSKTDPKPGISRSPAAPIVDKLPNPRTPVIERRNLDKAALQNVQDVKDSIRKMRTERQSKRHKVKFDGPRTPSAAKRGRGTATDSNNERLSSSRIPPSPVPSNEPRSSQTASTAGTAKRREMPKTPFKSQQHVHHAFNNSMTRLTEITMDDLEVGYLKTPTMNAAATHASMSSLQLSSLSRLSQWTDRSSAAKNSTAASSQKVELTKSIKKTKKLIKRTCRDVWTERDEIEHLQRKNWSIRKSLLQTEGPKDSVTTLNLRLEKALRKEREMSNSLDDIKDKKTALEADCSDLKQTISEFNDLLGALNAQVVPLLPLLSDNVGQGANAGTDRTGDGNANDQRRSSGSRLSGSRSETAALVMNLMDEDEFSDSIHSTDERPVLVRPQATSEEQAEPSLSLRHLREGGNDYL